MAHRVSQSGDYESGTPTRGCERCGVESHSIGLCVLFRYACRLKEAVGWGYLDVNGIDGWGRASEALLPVALSSCEKIRCLQASARDPRSLLARSAERHGGRVERRGRSKAAREGYDPSMHARKTGDK
jgi:hypothetical protein